MRNMSCIIRSLKEALLLDVVSSFSNDSKHTTNGKKMTMEIVIIKVISFSLFCFESQYTQDLTERVAIIKNTKLKSDPHLPKKFALFSSSKAL